MSLDSLEFAAAKCDAVAGARKNGMIQRRKKFAILASGSIRRDRVLLDPVNLSLRVLVECIDSDVANAVQLKDRTSDRSS